ncbi:MAG: tetratricopeptide repeat protein [Acidobacteriia bacterium]|nr:tetratricopeptide repeat protein [Terriglobia bacterium]
MGRLYAELAGSEGNREYVDKAIQHYQAALKLDPAAGIILEELTDLYVQTGKLGEAVSQAEDMLKQNPDNLDARRMLGRIYMRALGNSAESKIDEGTLRKAIDQYQQITAKDPKDSESWVVLGQLYRMAGKSPEAEKAYNSALQADPESEDALTGLAMLYANLGDTKRAIEKLKTVTEKSPNERTLVFLAKAYEEQKDWKNAADALKRAMALSPDNDHLARSLAQDLMFSEQLDEALGIYQKLAEEEPRDPQLPLSMAEIYRAKHDYGKAREALDKARKLDPESLPVRYEEISLLQAEGKTPEAIAALKALIDDTAKKSYSAAEGRDRAGMFEQLGVFYRGAAQYPQAVEAFRQMTALDKTAGPRAAGQIVDTYRTAKDYESAMREADAALKKFPGERVVVIEHADVLADQGKIDQAAGEVRALLHGEHDRETHLALAQIYEKGKRYSEMGKSLDEAEKLAASNEDKENIYFMRGAMYERMKKYDAAEAEFRKVLEMNPDSSGTLNYLGYMLADRGVRLDEAYQLVKKALDLDPDNGAYLDSLGWVYYRQGKYTEAEGLTVRALDRIGGQDPTVHDHLGDIYARLGKTRDAIAQWQASLKGFQTGAQTDADPEEMAKVAKKLDDARVRLANERKQ